MTRFTLIIGILIALLAVSAGPAESPVDLVRAANAALEAGELEAAELLYLQAEHRAADPGLVEFNLGIARFQRGDHRRAEESFRRALSDASIPPERRLRSLYNLGNCLVYQAGEKDIKQLQHAIDSFDAVVREASDDNLRRDAGYNLEVSKLLLIKARARKPAGQPDPEWKDPEERPNEVQQQPTDPKQENGTKEKLPEPKTVTEQGKDPGTTPQVVKKAVPGQGHLPVLPDTAEVPLLSAEQARALLLQAAERLQRERQKLRRDAAQGERPRANDW